MVSKMCKSETLSLEFPCGQGKWSFSENNHIRSSYNLPNAFTLCNRGLYAFSGISVQTVDFGQYLYLTSFLVSANDPPRVQSDAATTVFYSRDGVPWMMTVPCFQSALQLKTSVFFSSDHRISCLILSVSNCYFSKTQAGVMSFYPQKQLPSGRSAIQHRFANCCTACCPSVKSIITAKELFSSVHLVLGFLVSLLSKVLVACSDNELSEDWVHLYFSPSCVSFSRDRNSIDRNKFVESISLKLFNLS